MAIKPEEIKPWIDLGKYVLESIEAVSGMRVASIAATLVTLIGRSRGMTEEEAKAEYKKAVDDMEILPMDLD
jgi:hypothetical protein